MAARHEREASREMYLKERNELAKTHPSMPDWIACHLRMKQKFRADWFAAYTEMSNEN